MTTEQIKEQLAFWQNEWKKDLTGNPTYLIEVSWKMDFYRDLLIKSDDNEMMRNIQHKLFMRGNIGLSSEEKACLKRHGVKREGGKLFVGNFEISNVHSVRGDLNKVNFADRADKAAERQFSHMVNSDFCGKSFQEKFNWWLQSNNNRKHKKIVGAINRRRHYQKEIDSISAELQKNINRLIEQSEIDRQYYQEWVDLTNKEIAKIRKGFNR